MNAKSMATENVSSDMARMRKAAESVLLILGGQLVVGLVVLILFAISFLASPLRPLVWAQLAAVVVLIFGGLVLVVLVVGRYRGEILRILRRVLRR